MTPIAVKVYGGCYDGAVLYYEHDTVLQVGAEIVLQWLVTPATRYVYRFDGEQWVCVKWFFEYQSVDASSPFGGGV